MAFLALFSAALFSAACGGAISTGAQAEHGGDADVPRRPLSVGIVEAELAEGDSVADDGTLYHLYRLELEAGQRVRIRMQSRAVDSLLELRGPDQQVLRNDDAYPGTLDSLLEVTAQRAGAWQLRASALNAGERGAYVLTVEPRDPAGYGLRFALGDVVEANLGEHAQPDAPGTWLRFEGQAGAMVRLRITSTAFDTIATLVGPGGQSWVNDDANDVGADGTERSLDSTIFAALPDNGTYQLIVTPYGGQGAGPFRVRSDARPPIVLGPEGAPLPNLAGATGSGRILGLYAGITAYQTSSQLYGCADDARLLAEGMRRANLQRETEQLVLPDGLATRAGFLEGLAQLAQRAGPEDVVLVFFSGHGQQVADAREGGDELDALDETIVLFDGVLSDDEVVSALAPIRGTVVLAIDACHSGGFADDWVRVPGRVGLFSSDEDVLSDVAQPHRAGGYLSWHLRRGVLGEADARPRDGVLHAGELTDYLVQGFVDDHARMNPPGAVDRFQRLVMRRGSVSWGDLLWVYPRSPDLTLPPVPNVPLTSAAP